MTDPLVPGDHPPVVECCMQSALDYRLSLVAALLTRAVPNRCFDNAWRTFLRALPQVFQPDGVYVEGWFVVVLSGEIVVNEHAWCERADGRIIDPSVLLLVEPDCPVFYFAGVKRSCSEVEELVRRNVTFPYVRFDGMHGADGLGHPGYRAARTAARDKAIQLALATTPPRPVTLLTAQEGGEDPRDASPGIHIIIVTAAPRGEAGRA